MAVRTLGMETVVVIFVPSFLVHINWVSSGIVNRTRQIFDSTDAIGVFIAVLIIGSIMSIERRVLMAGLARIVLPLFTGSIMGAIVGTLVGAGLGMKPSDALFRVVVPIMGGGVTAGALPLAIGYSKVLATPQGEILALMLPSVILGNLAAIFFGGLLGFFDKQIGRSPATPDIGAQSLIGAANNLFAAPIDAARSSAAWKVGAAAVIIAALYFTGYWTSRNSGLPAPLVVLVFAGILQLTNILSTHLLAGIRDIYRFCIRVFTYPLLFVVGLLLTPWEKLMEGFAPVNLATIFATVATLSIGGYLASRWAGLRPFEGAIVTVTRAAMGGTGDIAILSAARSLELMPFAQISTRIGGAATVAAALIAIRQLSH
jgi:malate:Na+ symporter